MERSHRQQIQQWMQRLAEGDRSAFDPAFEALWPPVRRLTQRMLGDSSDVDDVAQTALMKTFAHAAQFDPERDALSWVLGIAAYECRTQRKRTQRRREEPAFTPDDPFTPKDLGALASTQATPEDAALARELEAAALAVLGTLSASDVATLHAMMHDGPRAASGATFRKRLQRSIGRLKAAWRSHHGTE